MSWLSNLFNNWGQNGGATKDPIDHRDLLLNEIVGGGDLPALPADFKLGYLFPVKNQGRTWSCVAQATAAHKQFQEGAHLSAKFIYKLCKQNDGLATKGTYTRFGVKTLVDYGVCEERLLPEADTQDEVSYLDFLVTQAELDNAKQYKSARYISCGVFDLTVQPDTFTTKLHESIKRGLYTYKQPVVIAIPWADNYQPMKDGLLPMPSANIKYGHALLCVGWNSNNELMLLNSWGENWGLHGYCFLRPEAPKFDAWTTIDVKDDEIPLPIKPTTKDVNLERRKALELRTYLYLHFNKADVARSWAGKNWLQLVKSYSYDGYSLTDLTNYIYSASRNLTLPFDLSKQRNQQ